MNAPEATYSPRLRTGVLLCGAGTAGAYHAGALRALTEAGVKIDVIAAHGTGVGPALLFAVDAGARLWDAAGLWADPRLGRSYHWRPALKIAFACLALAGLLLAAPSLVFVLGAAVYAAGVAAALIGLPGVAATFASWYSAAMAALFDPPVLPTVLPRLLVVAVLGVLGVLVWAAVAAARQDRSRRRWRGAFWWRLLGAPVDGSEPGLAMVESLWAAVRGASHEPRPSAVELGRRYVDLVADNFGQPGFREVLVAVHDIDARRDLVGAILPAGARGAFEARRPGPGPREAETVDFTGPDRELLVPFLLGSVQLPAVTSPVLTAFPAQSFWRGEQHRLCDRPELVTRLVEELSGIGVEQIILISPAAPPAVPHSMRTRAMDLRGRIGEMLRSVETAALEDGFASSAHRFSGAFVIRPDHNPIGPFDFRGTYDEASDRRRTLAELMQQGYADAYRHFIEPIVAVGDAIAAVE